ATPSADVNSELVLERAEPALQCTDHRGRDAGGVPVHPHHGAERLEPERVRQPLEKRVASIVMHDRLRHDRAKRSHAGREPGRNPAGVQRKVGAAGTSSHDGPQIAQFGESCTRGMLRRTERGREAVRNALSADANAIAGTWMNPQAPLWPTSTRCSAGY